MPITSSQIIEDSEQADGKRWITEEHTDSGGEPHRVTYFAQADTDAMGEMAARVVRMDERLVNREISRYLNRIEEGKNIIGLPYTETDQAQRALAFLKWAKEQALTQNHQNLRYACLVIDQFSEAQIDGLLGVGKGAKVKAWAEKIRDMKTAMDASELAAGEV